MTTEGGDGSAIVAAARGAMRQIDDENKSAISSKSERPRWHRLAASNLFMALPIEQRKELLDEALQIGLSEDQVTIVAVKAGEIKPHLFSCIDEQDLSKMAEEEVTLVADVVRSVVWGEKLLPPQKPAKEPEEKKGKVHSSLSEVEKSAEPFIGSITEVRLTEDFRENLKHPNFRLTKGYLIGDYHRLVAKEGNKHWLLVLMEAGEGPICPPSAPPSKLQMAVNKTLYRLVASIYVLWLADQVEMTPTKQKEILDALCLDSNQRSALQAAEAGDKARKVLSSGRRSRSSSSRSRSPTKNRKNTHGKGPRGEKGGERKKDLRNISCYKCHQKGHLARDCKD